MGEFKTESDQEGGEAVRENLKEQDEEVGFSAACGRPRRILFLFGTTRCCVRCARSTGWSLARGQYQRSKASAGRSHERNG